MTDDQTLAVNAAIHTASAAAAAIGAGLAQIPFADHVALMGIQTTMIITIGHAFEKNLDEAAARAVAGPALAAAAGRSITKVLTGWIPGVGNVVNASTAVAITEALGWKIAADFNREYQRDH